MFVYASGLAALAIVFFVGILYQIFYRLFLHPLRSVPGPWLNKITELPAAWALIRGKQHIYYRSLHDAFGPVVRVSPGELSFISADAREAIYGLRKNGLNMEKSPIFLGAVGNVNGQTGVSLALGQEHARQRRALGYLFTNSALLQLETLLQVHVHKFIYTLQQKATANDTVNVADWYTYLAFDVIGELCFAEPFGCLDQGSATEWSTSVINVFVAATYTQAIRRLSGVGTWLEKLMTWIFVPSNAAAWRNIHLNNSREKTMRRLADPNREHTDFIYQILNKESKKSLTETEIILNIALFISAGTDTTATALTGWTYYVCTHEKVYARLINEIRTAVKTEDSITWENIKGLRYLEATLYEALRLFAPSPASQQRIVPRGGASVDGVWLPEGTTVAVSPWSSTHSELNFKDPDDFLPERWLGEDVRYADDRLTASVPFGNGPRVCVGKNLALMEMRLIAAHLLWHFDIRLDRHQHKAENGVWGWSGRMNPMPVYHSMTKPPLWLQLKPLRPDEGLPRL